MPSTGHSPTLLSVTTAAADALAIEWDPPAGDVVDLYRIERGLDFNGPFTQTIQTSGGITTSLDTGLAASTTYFYRVVAVNQMGESEPSNVGRGVSRGLNLPAPQDVAAAQDGQGMVTVGWTGGPAGAVAVIEYGRGILQGTLPLAITSAGGSYQYFPGEPDTYFYRVKFVQGEQESPYSNSGLVILEDTYRVYLPLLLK